jgi:hypothetical protein
LEGKKMIKQLRLKQLGLFDAPARPVQLTAPQQTKALVLLGVLLTEAFGGRIDGPEIQIQEARDEDHG